MPTRRVTLHVRNLHDDTRREDLRRTFGRYGPIYDVCIPLNYYNGRPKGFAFVEFEDERDAEDAMRRLQGERLLGREIRIEVAHGCRRTPQEMKTRERTGRRGRDRSSRSRSVSPRRRSRSSSGGRYRRRVSRSISRS